MKILVAGATGAIGRSLVPRLAQAGHDVVGTTRRADRAAEIRGLGARPAIVDAFDRCGVFALLEAERPDAVIHQLSDLSARDHAANARLRLEGTRNLIDAALATDVRRVIAQSLAFAYAPDDGPAREDDPLDLDAPPPRRQTVAGVRALEAAVAEVEQGVILRYGFLYGPGTWYARDGAVADQVRRGELPATDGVASFVHVDDAARAALLALDWPPGPVNLVDDEPAPGTAWLPVFAAILNAPPPPVQPGSGRAERGASNARARTELGWEPLHPTWREGFPQALG